MYNQARLVFDDNPEHDIILNVSDFVKQGGMTKLATGEWIILEKDEPIPDGKDYIYKVKIVKNVYKTF